MKRISARRELWQSSITWFALCLLLFVGSLDTSARDFTLNTNESGRYYLQNVQTGMFLGAGNNWGTQASLMRHPEYVTLIPQGGGVFYLETQYNNGGGSSYLGSNLYMDSTTPVNLTFTPSGQYFTISVGSSLLGYDGTSTILASGISNRANALWQVYSENEMLNTLTVASKDNPVDATFLITDPNFSRNHSGYSTWSFKTDNKNNSGESTNFCVESYRASFEMSQTIYNVPNGIYGLKVQGFFRYENTEEMLPVFFINNTECLFPERIGAENSMSQASVSFSNGMYYIEEMLSNVSNGRITLGAKGLGTNLWCIWDNFELTYYGIGENDEVRILYKSEYNIMLEEFMSMKDEVPNIAFEETNYFFQDIASIMDDEDIDYLEDAMSELRDMLNNLKTLKKPYANLKAVADKIQALRNQTGAEWENLLNSMNDILQEAEEYDDSDSLEDLTWILQDSFIYYLKLMAKSGNFVLTSGKSYYIMNKYHECFLSSGNAWGTQISLLEEGMMPDAQYVLEKSTETMPTSGLETTGWRIRLDGKYNFKGFHPSEYYDYYQIKENTYLFRESEENGYVDLNGQTHGYLWKITRNDNGTFYIQTVAEDTYFPNASTQYAGGYESGESVSFNCTDEDSSIEWYFIPVNGYDEAELRRMLVELADEAATLTTVQMYGRTKQELAAAINAVQTALASNDADQISTSYQLLDKGVSSAKASIAKYNQLSKYINEASQLLEAYEAVLDNEAKATISSTITQLQTAYEYGVLSNDEIDQVWPSLQQTAREQISKYITPLSEQATSQMNRNISDEVYANLQTAVQLAKAILLKKEYTAADASDIQTALAQLRTAIADATAYIESIASLTDYLSVGKDLTALIFNPNFTRGQTGWTAENMFQYGGATEGCVIGTTYTNGDVTISKFAEAWNPNQPVADAQIYQTLANMPAGAYALEADVITAAYGDSTSLRGVHLFAESANRLTTMLCRTDYDQPEHRRLLVNHEGGDLTIGVRIRETNANWIAMDNFRLFVAEAPDASDIAILQEALEQMGGSDKWLEPWELATNPFSPAGVTFTNRHVTDIDLSGYGVTGNLPTALLKLPNLQSINLSDNHLSGDVATVLSPIVAAKQTYGLKNLDISKNQLSGNIGLIGAVCPNLESLNASANHIDNVLPFLSSSISTVDLSNQMLPTIWDFHLADVSLETMMGQIPPILLYDHSVHGIGNSLSYECRNGDWSMQMAYSNGQFTFYSNADNVFYGQSGDVMNVKSLTGSAIGSTSQMRLYFSEGDANFNGRVDVLDLQTMLKFMFDEYDGKPFNFTASNLWMDDIINVQDAVSLVNILLDFEVASVRMATLAKRVAPLSSEVESSVYIENGQLIINTTVPVASFDIVCTISQECDIVSSLSELGFICSVKKKGNQVHLIGYSLNGALLPVGHNTICRLENGIVDYAMLADKDAQEIRAFTNGIETNIKCSGINLQSDKEIYRIPLGARRAIVIDGLGKKTIIKDEK